MILLVEFACKGGDCVIYDYIDMPSKVGVAASAAKWLGVPGNVEILRSFCEKYNIFNEIIAIGRPQEEKDLLRLLQLIGVGAIVPLFNKGRKEIRMGIRQGWSFPEWVYNTESWHNLNLHVEQILEARGAMKAQHARPLILNAALDRFNQWEYFAIPPRPPHVNAERDRALIRELRSRTGQFRTDWRRKLWKNTRKH